MDSVISATRTLSAAGMMARLDACPPRPKGQKAENCNALFELLFRVATFWLMLRAKWILQRRRSADMTFGSTGET